MEWIENEGVELGADNLEAMVRAFGVEHKARIERFFSDFYIAKEKLKNWLPHTFEKVAPEKRSEVQAAIVEFLTAVKEQNAEFLNLCIMTYAQRLGAAKDAALRSEDRQASSSVARGCPCIASSQASVGRCSLAGNLDTGPL
jgi:hypothetical protein